MSFSRSSSGPDDTESGEDDFEDRPIIFLLLENLLP